MRERPDLEYKRRGDLVGSVANKDVKRREIHLDHVAEQNFQLLLEWRPLNSLRNLCAAVTISELPCNAIPQMDLVGLTSAAMRGSSSTAMTLRAFSRIRTVKLPVPGPTSRTVSVGLRSAF